MNHSEFGFSNWDSDIQKFTKADLVKNVNDTFDIYGFIIGKSINAVHISEIYDKKPFEYTGSWLGGFGPHGNGILSFLQDGITITTNFNRGCHIVEDIVLQDILIDGTLCKSYFLSNSYHNKQNNDMKLICLVQSLPLKIKLAQYDFDHSSPRDEQNCFTQTISKISDMIIRSFINLPTTANDQTKHSALCTSSEKMIR